MRERLVSLQILRAVAAVMVVQVHAVYFSKLITGQLPWIGAGRLEIVGSAGVDIFFVLSGAIIFLTAFADRPMGWRDFIGRRFTRVAPIYWIATLACVALGLLRGARYYAKEFLTAVFFWPAWGDIWFPPLRSGWTLSFEMLFYAGAALVLWRRALLWVILAAYAACWIANDVTHWAPFRHLGNPIILEFAMGAAVAALLAKRRAPAWIGLAAISAGAVLLLIPQVNQAFGDGLPTMRSAVSLVRVLIWGVPAALLLAGAFVCEPLANGPVARFGAYLGDASYSIYLAHLILFDALTPLAKPWLANAPADLLAIAGIVIAVAVGVAVHERVEKPLLSALRRPAARAAGARAA